MERWYKIGIRGVWQMVRLLSIGIECISAVVVLQFFVLRQRSFWRFVMVLLLAFYGIAVFSVTISYIFLLISTIF